MDHEKWVFDVNQDFGANTKSDFVGMSIAHVCDLFISGTDASISYVHKQLENEYGSEVFEGGEAIYLRAEIKRSLTN